MFPPFLQKIPQEKSLDHIQIDPNNSHSDLMVLGREFHLTDVFFDRLEDQKPPLSPAFHQKASTVLQIKRTICPAEYLPLQNTALSKLPFFLPGLFPLPDMPDLR